MPTAYVRLIRTIAETIKKINNVVLLINLIIINHYKKYCIK